MKLLERKAARARLRIARGSNGVTPPRRRRWWPFIVTGFALLAAGLTYTALPTKVGKPFDCAFAVGDPAFINTMSALMRSPFVDGNQIDVLENGDEIFPAMLQAITDAKKTITLETYIWSSGELSDRFITALSIRARAGVKVHVIADGIGTIKLSHAEMDAMKEAGVGFVNYARARWYRAKLNLNHRSHRKLLIVDGRIGFTGGVCIADEWLGNGEEKGKWRDTHVRVEGPIVAQMQAVFAVNWLQTTGELLVGPDYFPELRPEGNLSAQALMSGPNEEPENARTCLLLAIAAARKSILLGHAYFVPDDVVLEMLVRACQRGVSVELVVPLENDSTISRAASRSRWGPLLDAGAVIHRYEPALYHSKTIIVDDLFVSIGSVNFDNRSFTINDEFNLNLYGRDAARPHIEVFERDGERSLPYSTEQHGRRPIWVKMFDYACGLLRLQL
jgi:cardiolipin synthase A/B